ncbi:MAG: metalloregulator ArsR/SmtB family transcription factor [Chloroflexota bacterium]
MTTEARTGTRASTLPPIRILSGPAFELVAQLSAFTSGPARASLESGKTWIRQVRELAGAELIRGVERWAITLYGELSSVVLEAGPPYRPEQLVRQLRAMKPAALAQRLLGADSPQSRAMLSRDAFDKALAGHPGARAEVVDTLGSDPSARQSLERLLSTKPEFVQAEIAAIVETWAQRVFPTLSETSLPLIERDVGSKERLFARTPRMEAMRIATNGVELASLGWADEIVLVPTVALRPFIVPVEWRSTLLIMSSVGDAAFDQDPEAPPRRLVQAAAALGDALRLRLLHELAVGEMTATELAEALSVERTSLHHHLGILRSAGLVGVRAEGLQSWLYSVRFEGIDATTAALDAYLRPPED